ncbi:MAG: hypothetical protein ABJN43_02850 [Sneathiella sp.]
MKAISISQPFCHHILTAGKDVENRDWPTSYRGDILLLASRKVPVTHQAYVRRHELFTGGIVGIAKIIDCVEVSASEWFSGPYGFVMTGQRAIPFIPCRGAPKIFVPDLYDVVMAMYQNDQMPQQLAAQILGLSPGHIGDIKRRNRGAA